MGSEYFPDPRTSAFEEGLLAVSEFLNTNMLKDAYTNGIFPWPYEEGEVLWFSPPMRGILFFDELIIPKSLQKAKRSTEFSFTINKSFAEVITECARQPRPEQGGTWITEQMLEAYMQLHRDGYILSAECWDGEDLVGGIYGVFINNVFSGESMFYKKSNASKLSLLFLIEHLKSKGLKWMDIQMVTPLLETFGGKEIPRDEYLDLLQV